MGSFWNSLVIPWTRDRFTPVLRACALDAPSAQLATEADRPRLAQFLEQHFGTGRVVLKPVLDPSNEIILWIGDDRAVLATIRYKSGGMFEGQPIHLIDCFCMHPSVRRTGLASKLLGALHRHTNQRTLRYSLFLKEGNPLPYHEPLYSSSYAFRRVARTRPSEDLKPLSPRLAAALIGHYRHLRPDTVWIYNETGANQNWRFWKRGMHWMLACVQDAFQELDGLRIGWMTAFFASGTYDINQIVENLPFDWIWLDVRWLRGASDAWTLDMPFHWYAYQWTTCLQIQDMYGIVL